MRILFQLTFIFFSFFCFAQEDTNWYTFYNSDSTKIGFKDSNGNIKIEPKFESYFTEPIFKNVTIVSEKIADKEWKNYYLNKQGKIFGIDSIYIFDFEYAKESEGKIKFRDPKTDKVGFFDKNGKVVIPAVYNDARDFSKGLAIVIKNAHKERWEPEGQKHEGGCDHWSWQGGKTFAINHLGKELFEILPNNDYSFSIDYGNVKINEKTDPNIYTSYKGTDGNIYSFSSPEKDFNVWFENIFFPDFKKNKTILPEYFYDLISVAVNDNPKEQTAWKNHKKSDYLQSKAKLINQIFENLNTGKLKKNVSWETLSNNSYYPQNELPKTDLTKNTVVSVSFNEENDYSSDRSFQFTKIGDSFYITSAP
jgi:hypothetical protein